VTTSLQSAA